ncbi:MULTISPECIES: hypothetical protein [unclassified Arsukibacterium]|uniref:hypothetical protein n=1 Tax=unclassified Arsukibacterium TaxID=2635278 RepID=UPI000C3A0AC0|nr:MULTISPECIES: hypothetical protein [unclassified Arsukibacterium]MAA95964.1 hypothetical protein [Rheinheimera sp.]MBM33446.1 hypothetical protein [Rheinheimera sp.]HAW91822.1 hypothetical protein [Candidatus Azambacteria bacterium]|tara:strand:- start:23829 stop:24587 length:759 start_codon:yes stop_codon:yes gene_type:complete
MVSKVLLFVLLISTPLSLIAAPKLTIYDDGRSCPANCDAHVVVHKSLNGTKFVHDPDSSVSNPVACKINSFCKICFDDNATECLVTQYRGSGPGKNTFDLTPAFYQQWCAKDDLPSALKSKCQALQKIERKLDGRVNCIKEPDNTLCIELIAKAEQAQARDNPKYEQCLQIGQTAYNSDKQDAEKRQHHCAYEYESNGGPNSRGLKWKKLLPGVCRKGTYVGRDGLDCCSGVAFADAAFGAECRDFYPKKPL